MGPVGAKVLIVTPYSIVSEKAPISSDAYRVLQKAYPGDISNVLIFPLCQHTPSNNDFKYLEGSEELASGLAALESYVLSHPPEIIISLGEKPLNYLAREYNINNWRGSPLTLWGVKYLPTLDSGIYGTFTTIAFDLQKALDYQHGRERTYINNFSIVSDPIEQRSYFDEILSSKYVAVDIETRRDGNLTLLCVGFGCSAERAICFVASTESQRQNIAELLPQLKNILYHNSIFDYSVLNFFHNIRAPLAVFDTLTAQHVLEPELPKDLGFLCSTLTWRPCYWGSVKFSDDKTWSTKRSLNDLYVYNCLDVCVTYEAFEKQSEELALDSDLKAIFDFELANVEVAYHMSATGFFVDHERLSLLRKVITNSYHQDYLMLCMVAEKNVLVSSPKQVKEYLYDELKLPVKRDKKGVITTGEDALVSLITFCKAEQNKIKSQELKDKYAKRIVVLKLLLNIRGYEKLLSSYINVGLSNDGRLRGLLKPSSTESGRWAGGNWLDDTGLNVQTLPRRVISITHKELSTLLAREDSPSI